MLPIYQAHAELQVQGVRQGELRLASLLLVSILFYFIFLLAIFATSPSFFCHLPLKPFDLVAANRQ
jgi:hypothetical protein